MNNEFEIWTKFIEGDNSSLEKIYKRYFEDLYTYGLKVHSEPSLVKDSIQDIFIDLIQRRRNLKATATTHHYLFKALRNKITQELRTENRKIEIANTIANQIDVVDNQIAQQETTSMHESMQNAIDKLSRHQREAIFLKYTQGLKYEEIAQIIEIDVASARTLIYRSLKKVKDFIGTI